MEAVAFVLGVVVLGVLALRFGQDSREGLRSKEHELASHGVSWADLAADREAPVCPRPTPYPTLAFIERGLGVADGALTLAPDPERMEVQARSLTREYWSDAVWTTGVVPEAAFRRVLAVLAPALLDTLLLTVERPSTVAEPVVPTQTAPAADARASAPAWDQGLGASLELAGSIATA